MRRREFVAVVATVAIIAAGAGTAWAGGYWNMPGTWAQRTGHGYSGGYHAPFILGPIKLDGWVPPNEVRLPYAPSPFGCCTCNCDCGRAMESPSTIEGQLPTAAVPAPKPRQHSTAPTRPPAAARAPVAPIAPTVKPSTDRATEYSRATNVATQSIFDAPVQR